MGTVRSKGKKRSRADIEAQFFPELLGAEDRALEGEFIPASTYADDFDIVKLMSAAEDPDTGLLRDLKIDDRDLYSAKNYYDYAFNVIGKDANPPWLIQMWTGLMLFAEYCPNCSDPRWIDLGYIVEYVDKGMPSQGIIEHLQLLENGKCPKCKKFKYELIQKYGLRNYQELVNCLGQRSGKSSSAASYASYLTHRYLKFPKLASLTTAMQKSTELTGTFVSLTFSKAEGLLWTPYLNIINESEWFGELHALLDHYGNKYGVELYRKKDLFIKYYHKNLKFYPTHPNGNILRGDCLVGSTMLNTTHGFVHFDELEFAPGLVPSSGRVATPYGVREYSHTYAKRDRELVGVRTRNGFTLKGTPEHPVMVLTPNLQFKWVRLDALRSGDWIVSATAKASPIFGCNDHITKDIATILGMFTANGFRNTISSDDPLVVKEFYGAVKRTLGYPPVSCNSGIPGVRANDHKVLTGGKGTKGSFLDTLESWGYLNVRSAEKQIPLTVRTAPKEIIHAYLEAYFACDCGINGGATSRQRAKGRTTSVEVELSSASTRLVAQLQVILLHIYGIVGRRHRQVEVKRMGVNGRNAPKKYITWVLTLSGYDAHLFQQTFKSAKIQKYKDRIKATPAGVGSDRRLVPHLRPFITNLWGDLRKQGRLLSSGFLVKADGSKVRSTGGYSFIRTKGIKGVGMPESLAYADHSALLETLAHVDSSVQSKVAKVLSVGAHYEEVVSVKTFTDTQTVYDITVPQGHAFYANGLASHNTRILSVVDELGLFPLPSGEDEEDEQSARANADEAHKSLTNSLVTVQAIGLNLLREGINVPPALMMGVSSPMSVRDKIMRLLADARSPEGAQYILGIQLPTWKVNPTIERDTPIIALAYARNPEKAERDFGANPPRVHSPFVSRSLVKYELFSQKPSHQLVYQYDQPGMLYAKVEKLRSVGFPSLVTIDAGSVNNSFCLTGAHYNFDSAKTEVSTLLEIMPHEGRRIDFNLVYQHVILPVCRDLNAVALLADQWQSLDILHRAKEDMGLLPDGKPRCLSKQHSPRRKNFDFLLAMMENSNLLFPWLVEEQFNSVLDGSILDFRLLNGKPVQHFVLQLLTVRDLGTGRTPGKGEGFTDDIFRALVLQTLIHEPKIMERLKNAVLVDPTIAKKNPLPVMIGRSTGVGGRRY